jgi:hypothetical protein
MKRHKICLPAGGHGITADLTVASAHPLTEVNGSSQRLLDRARSRELRSYITDESSRSHAANAKQIPTYRLLGRWNIFRASTLDRMTLVPWKMGSSK